MTVVIVGSSVAGIHTAKALRQQHYDGDIVVLGAEAELPYDKPPLSKAALAGTMVDSHLRLLSEADSVGCTLRLGVAATHLDVRGGAVGLVDGSTVEYSHVVVATGASARPSPWSLPGTHVLRTLADARELTAELNISKRLAVIGAGFIGTEVAATARSMGLDVTVIDPLAPLSRVAPIEISAVLQRKHESHGVRVVSAGVSSVQGQPGGLTLGLTDGTDVVADLIVVGIGATPNDAWLRDSGLVIDDGVVCDEYCRAVQGSSVWAVGDVARWWHARHGRLVRLEHWTNAITQARAVARNIVGTSLTAYAPVEYVWTDQYDWRLQFLGTAAPDAAAVRVGDHDDSTIWLYGGESGQLAGAVLVNKPQAMRTCTKGIETQMGLGEVAELLQAAQQ